MFDFFRAWGGLKIPVYLLLGTMALGMTGFKFLYPEESLLRLLYMTGITLSTVGYGDILGIHDNPWAIVYTTLLMFGGMGVVLYSTSLVTAYIIEGNLRDAFYGERVKRRISKMENHYIVCGAGETGIHVVREIYALGEDCVVIENDPEKKDEIMAEFPKLSVLIGDATTDHLLEEAGIEKARVLVAALSNDKDNLFLTVTAKLLQPRLSIVSKAVELTMIKKLKRAGASRVVSPNYIGGLRMASEVLKPHVTQFIDDVSDKIREQEIPEHSPLVGKKLKDIDFYGDCGVNILGLGDHWDKYETNVDPLTELKSGQILIYIGSSEHAKRVNSLVSGT